MARPSRVGLALSGVLGLFGACSGGPDDTPSPGPSGEALAQTCLQEVDEVTVEALSDLTGSFDLSLQADDGPTTRARLTLEPVPASDGDVPTVPGATVAQAGRALARGWTDLDGSAVGAFSPGDLGSMDPDRPGALLLISPAAGGGSSVMIRLGDQANDRRRTNFDGGHFALTIRWTGDDSSFGGTWTSQGRGLRASGSFCATPATP